MNLAIFCVDKGEIWSSYEVNIVRGVEGTLAGGGLDPNVSFLLNMKHMFWLRPFFVISVAIHEIGLIFLCSLNVGLGLAPIYLQSMGFYLSIPCATAG